jgi:hypothetical protein
MNLGKFPRAVFLAKRGRRTAAVEAAGGESAEDGEEEERVSPVYQPLTFG